MQLFCLLSFAMPILLSLCTVLFFLSLESVMQNFIFFGYVGLFGFCTFSWVYVNMLVNIIFLIYLKPLSPYQWKMQLCCVLNFAKILLLFVSLLNSRCTSRSLYVLLSFSIFLESLCKFTLKCYVGVFVCLFVHFVSFMLMCCKIFFFSIYLKS